MSKEEVVEKTHHTFYGMLMEAAFKTMSPGERSMWMKLNIDKVDKILGIAYDAGYQDGLKHIQANGVKVEDSQRKDAGKV